MLCCFVTEYIVGTACTFCWFWLVELFHELGSHSVCSYFCYIIYIDAQICLPLAKLAWPCSKLIAEELLEILAGVLNIISNRLLLHYGCNGCLLGFTSTFCNAFIFKYARSANYSNFGPLSAFGFLLFRFSLSDDCFRVSNLWCFTFDRHTLRLVQYH